MKVSVTLSRATAEALDRIAGRDSNRSRVIEQAVAEFVERRRRAAWDARDVEIINRVADELNEEMADVLGYQVRLRV